MEATNSNQDFENNYKNDNTAEKNQDSVFNVRVKAGSRRTYFFDVKTNRKEDFFVVITERRKKINDDKNYDKNKLFLYKEDFNKFLKGLNETIGHIKTELMPGFDFCAFDREKQQENTSDNYLDGSTGGSEAKLKKEFYEDDVL